MTDKKPQIFDIKKLAEDSIQVDPLLQEAKNQALANNLVPLPNTTGSFLSTLVLTNKATNVVEIGNDTGVAGLWVLNGLTKGTFTSVSSSENLQEITKSILEKSNPQNNRISSITSDPIKLLTKFTEEAYNLIFVNLEENLDLELINKMFHILKPNGCLVIRNIFSKNNFVEINQELEKLNENINFIASILPIEEGLLLIVRE